MNLKNITNLKSQGIFLSKICIDVLHYKRLTVLLAKKIFLDLCHRSISGLVSWREIQKDLRFPFSEKKEKKSGVIRAALRYNNLPSIRTIKISHVAHRFAVFTSPRIDFIFHIPLAEEGTIVRAISFECENGVTLLFRRRSYPPSRILLFTRDPVRFRSHVSCFSATGYTYDLRTSQIHFTKNDCTPYLNLFLA